MNRNIFRGTNLIAPVMKAVGAQIWIMILCACSTSVGNLQTSRSKSQVDSAPRHTINHYKNVVLRRRIIPHTYTDAPWMSPSLIHLHGLKLSRQQFPLDSVELVSRRRSSISTTWTNPTTNPPVSRGYIKTATVGNTLKYVKE